MRRSTLILLAVLGCDDGASTAVGPSPPDQTDAALSDIGPLDSAVADALVDAEAMSDAAADAMPDAMPDAAPDPGYADSARWVCHPDLESDVCRTDLDVTAVAADGTLTRIPHVVAADPAVDCFYVYPTTSVDGAGNSDWVPNDEEHFIVHEHAGPFSRLCRVFAPVYRQVTVTGLVGRDPERWQMAYADVEAAWMHYRSNNPDRPVILIGHSQGASHLRQLMSQHFDDVPTERARLVSAYLIGSSVGVPPDGGMGGTFDNIPLCSVDNTHGCIVSYASYRETQPPPEMALFGGPAGRGLRSACVNPAALAGDPQSLDALFPSTVVGFYSGFTGANPSPFADPEAAPTIETPHFAVPGLLAAECVRAGPYDYLSVRINADPADPRADDIVGDISPTWGLHLVDVHLVMGDLLRLAEMQVAAWSAP